MVAWIGVETNFYASVLHLFHDVASLTDAWILLAAADEEHIEVLIEATRIAQNAGYLLFQVEVGCAPYATEHTR